MIIGFVIFNSYLISLHIPNEITLDKAIAFVITVQKLRLKNELNFPKSGSIESEKQSG